MGAITHISYPADGIGMITLDNPPQNHGSYQLAGSIEGALHEIREHGSRVVMIVSDNPEYFCPGQWLPDAIALHEGGKPSGDGTAWYRIVNELDLGPMVSIAVNNGIALGGGAELCWSCNLRVAGKSAVFGQVEVLLGDIPGAGGTVRLPRLAGKAIAMEMVLSGRPFPAHRLHELGIVNRVFPDETLRQDAIEFARLFAANPATGLQEAKNSVNQGLDLPLKEALRNETRITRAMDKTMVIEKMRKIVSDYDAGKDSFDVYGFPELRPL